MARIAKATQLYLADLTDEEWDRLALLMQKPQGPSTRGGLSRSDQCSALPCSIELWLVQFSDPFRGVAFGLWLALRTGAQIALPDDP